MGTIPLPLPWMDEHRAGHPPALLGGRDPKDCPFCKTDEPVSAEQVEPGHNLISLLEHCECTSEAAMRAADDELAVLLKHSRALQALEGDTDAPE